MARDYGHGYKPGLNPGLYPGQHSAMDLMSTSSVSSIGTNRFDIWFLEFSNLYSLSLRRPKTSLSIDKTRPSPYYHENWFYSTLKEQYNLGNADIILRSFDKEARDVHSRWVKKSRGELGVTPTYTNLPRATSESERSDLLERLTAILESLAPSDDSQYALSEPDNYPTHEEIPAPQEYISPRPRRPSKRSSERGYELDTCSKRSRAAIDASRPPSVLSRLDSGEIRSATPESSASLPLRSSQRSGNIGLDRSFETNKASFVSEVFTQPEGRSFELPATQDTQVTVENANSQHAQKWTQESVDSLYPSSSTERALVASFQQADQLQQNASQPRRQGALPHVSFPDTNIDPSPRQRTQYTHHEPDVGGLKRRLEAIWPVFPPHLQDAPFAVRWEIMRVALHCEIPPQTLKDLAFVYEPAFNNHSILWDRLRRLDIFEGKVFPEKPKPEAWNAAMSDRFCSLDQIVTLTASLTVNPSAVGPLFNLRLQPLKLDLPHRLDRRFGSDRFLELLIPSMHSRDVQGIKKTYDNGIDAIHSWLARDCHIFLGRVWKSFFTKDGAPKKIHKDNTLVPEVVTIFQERIYFFAENGNDFGPTDRMTTVSPPQEPTHRHTKMERAELLNWLLQIKKHRKNQEQTVCKLFSRISLGLSRTRPTVVLMPEQIRHHDQDILSPAGKEMNDGIARMSTALARRIRDVMGLDDTPAGFQGRFGSAKGFWLRDTEDRSDDIWIETYPSQRKWKCDYEEEDQRTFEVLKESKELRSATLNLQLLPILEDRAINRAVMREEVGRFMRESLEAEMEAQKEAMKDAAQFKLWVYENGAPARRQDRIRLGHVPWNGGLPNSKEDQMEFLLSHGFDPKKLEFLRKIAYDMRKAKCDELEEKLNVRVGRSTYAYMTIDFLGVLEEDEIHFGFSSKFTDERSGFSETFLHGIDVLVARTPAHYPSDIQRVKAVFKPELGSLKDVIIFPRKGLVPLADKLSGGDYDGDIAWVCWEPTIVQNFKNADPPPVPDLFTQKVLSKKSDTYSGLAEWAPDVTTEFLDLAFRFNMEKSLLGACTNYKEKLCYSRKCVSDWQAIYLSTLISQLVDRAKQGTVFTEEAWTELRRNLFNPMQGDGKLGKARADPPQPEYKKQNWGLNTKPTHIIDYVKFVVGKPTVEHGLKDLTEDLKHAEKYDRDLVKFIEHFENLKRPLEKRKKDELEGRRAKNTWETILDDLKQRIDAVGKEWDMSAGNNKMSFETKVAVIHEKWQNILPTDKVNSNTLRSLREDGLAKVGLSQWDLLKASYCFKMYYNKSFPWYIAGYQLAYLKSIATSGGKLSPPALLTPEMYAGTRPDAKFIRAVAARNMGLRFENAIQELEVFDGDGSVEDDD
ncbi:hypothetical protein GGS20DRAFT_583902 [Poronia punctata]|nr:hypothetical protein GGS20DRAFT_583902 [Poronia punctata]